MAAAWTIQLTGRRPQARLERPLIIRVPAPGQDVRCPEYPGRTRTRTDVRNIWEPHHLDKTRRFRTSMYIPVYTGMRFSYRLILVYTAIYQTGMVYTCIYGIKEMMVFQSLGLCFPVESCRYTLPTYSKTHPGASSAIQSMFSPVELKLGTFMYIQVYTFMISTSRYVL